MLRGLCTACQNAQMDINQARIIELLREVHLIAFKEIEQLNLRIAELENQSCQPLETPIVKRPTANMPTDHQPSTPKQPETGLLNEHEVAAYVNLSVASVRRWRLFRKGPTFLKIGSAVRYKRGDVEAWLNSCPGLR
jgi:predicted DNA-binding transcriptional regulator AlpA